MNNKEEVKQFLMDERDRLERDEPYAVNTIAAFDTVINAL
jgi:hypothetical protein